MLEKIRKDGYVFELNSHRLLCGLSYIDVSKRPYRFAKRLFDVVISALALTVLALPMAAIAIAIRIDSHGKAVFQQKRVGAFGKRFKMYKFRSMRIDTPKYLSTYEVDDPEKYITHRWEVRSAHPLFLPSAFEEVH